MSVVGGWAMRMGWVKGVAGTGVREVREEWGEGCRGGKGMGWRLGGGMARNRK